MRPLFVGSLSLSLVVMTAALCNQTWLEDSQRWIHRLTGGAEAQFKTAETESQLMAVIQSCRHEDSRKMLQGDVELHNWLTNRLENVGQVDLQELANEIQESCPRYMKLSSTAMQSSTIAGLYQQVTQWNELDDKDFTHVAVVARLRPAGLGYEAIVFAGQRLGDLVPELIGHGRDQFFSVCPLCGNGQTGMVLTRKRTVFLECPDCHHVYAVVAVDTHGTFHYVSQYLKGYAPNVHFPAKKKLSRLAEMARIWDEVIHTVEYVPDSADGVEDNDAWQFAHETERLGTGDCEDSSIYLADWLASRGFEVRVALGRYGEKGGHAWVVVRLEGNCYLLEATDSHANVSHPPMVAETSKLYVPDALFDREATYVRRFPTTVWSGDYFAPDQWTRVEPPGVKSAEPVATRVNGTTNAMAKSPAAAPSQH